MAKFKNENGEELDLDAILGEDSEYQAAFDKKIAKALEKQKADVDAEVKKKLDAALAGREEEIRKSIQDDIVFSPYKEKDITVNHFPFYEVNKEDSNGYQSIGLG